jgi:hypothetical protein
LFNGENDIPISYIDAAIALRRCYDKANDLSTGSYGIEMTKSESPAEYSLYGHWARVYREERIKDHYGISFDDFLKRPRYRIEIMLEEVRAVNDKDSKDSAELRKQFEASLQQAKNDKG